MSEDPSTIRIQALLAEYQAMYALAQYRLQSLDRRAPVSAGAMLGLLSGLGMLSGAPKVLGFAALPFVCYWLARTTIGHARSFEDALRRIEELEHQINRLCGEQLVAFQSRHPSRGRHVGGRTGSETIGGTLTVAALSLLACCALLLPDALNENQPGFLPAVYAIYFVGVSAAAGAIARIALRTKRYRYNPKVDTPVRSGRRRRATPIR